MGKKNGVGLSLIGASLIFSSLSARADQAIFGGALRLNLPKPDAVEPLKVQYKAPGSMIMSATVIAGDGDVVNFSKTHPALKFAEGNKAQVVIGYWIHPLGSSSLPTNSNWVPIGYQDLNLQAPSTPFSDVKIINKANAVDKAYKQMKTVIDGLVSRAQTSYVLQGQSVPKYQVHFAAMVGSSLSDAKGTGVASDLPTALEWAAAFNKAESDLSGSLGGLTSDTLDHFKKVTVSQPGAATEVFKFADSPSAVDISGNRFFLLAKEVLSANVYTDLAPGTRSSLEAISARLSTPSAGDCRALSGNTIPSSYWWEPFPLQLTCRALDGGGQFASLLKTFQDYVPPAQSKGGNDNGSGNAGGNGDGKGNGNGNGVVAQQASSLAAPAAASSGKEILAQLLVKAATLAVGQDISQVTRATAKVFVEGVPYIDNIISSVPIPVPDAGGSVKAMQPPEPVHPEPAFAIYDYRYYYTTPQSDGDKRAVTMSTTDTLSSDLALTLGDVNQPSAGAFMSDGVGVSFRLRGLPGVSPSGWFCRNDYSR
ncbi:MAG: hypothetical protein KGQ59_12295 [Bdellovibrionales bacterium]|nr:hypothetical protein [Bdellovibrionales bacterium]